MADFSRPTERFFYGGLSCFPPDALPVGKFPYVKNMRVYADGELRPRNGLSILQTINAAIHSIARLNDPTTFNGGVPAVRVLGANGDVYRGVPSNPTPAVLDSGYSGDPLTTLTAQPPQSPRPWIYVADADRYRKFTTDGDPYAVGLAQPSAPDTEPTVALDVQHISDNDIQTSTAWSAAGSAASAPTLPTRINTTISQILYDDGVTGYASIVPADTANITVGTLLTVGAPLGVFENALVTDITIAVTPTTVEAIIYDAGTTGLCTIQPAGSLGTGQLDAPPLAAYELRATPPQMTKPALVHGPNFGKTSPIDRLPPEPITNAPVRRIRQVDFPVNALVVLNAAETVRILSVAVGTDGKLSFRCRTTTTISAGHTITGLAAFRIFLEQTWPAGSGLLRQAVGNNLTYPEPLIDEKSKVTGGIQAVYAIDLSQFSDGTAVLPDDELHLAVKVDRLTEVVSVRVYIDIDQTTNDFLQNYFFHEWRASDIVTAIQGTNAANVTPLVDVRRTVVANQQLEQQLSRKNVFEIGLTRRNEEGKRVGTHDVTTRRNRMMAQAQSQSAIATQMALGNNQWIDLRVKIGTLTRVGTDPTRTLANAQAFEILIAAEAPIENIVPEPLNIEYSDLQIYGGGGLDVGEVGDPYVWAYRYRSSATGAVSNPSPACRGGSIPRRQDANLVATPSTDPQVDKIDWFRFGGGLPEFTYVGTGPNTAAVFVDDRMDSAIDGGEVLAYDNFQPWPLQDLPRVGTCNVAGTAIQWASGDAFNTAWAPGSVILVNGRATTLYASPATATLLHVVENVGSGTGVEFSLPGPTLLSQPLRSVWGDYQGFYFACGDAINPGTLYWTHGNNIETTNDANALIVTTPSEPLQAGGMYNTFPFVASTEELYALVLQPNETGPVRAIRTPCGRGFWTPWAWCVAPEGIYFLAPDGLALTGGGSPAEMITTPDLRNIFPKDGLPGQTTNGIPAPDMTATDRLRLSYIAGWLYFDYVDTDGAAWTLLYDTAGKRFLLDTCAKTDLRVRLEEPGSGVYDQLIGGDDGTLLQYDEAAIQDVDTDLAWALHTRWVDGGASRTLKQFGDLGLALDAKASVAGILVEPVAQDGTVFPPSTTVGAGDTGRQSYIIELNAGDGVIARNIGLNISGTLGATDTDRPILYWWEPAYLLKAENIARRATDWEDLGYLGAKFIQGVIIRANTYGQDKTIQIQKDGAALGIALSINHTGEQQIAYPLASVGWEPFVTELIRIIGVDDVDWQLLGWRFVWEPAPELATEWHTQWTSQDYPGYQTVRDMVIGYEATAPLILTFYYDDHTQVYTIPANGGNYSRFYFPFCPNKEKAVKYQWKTAEPGRIYKQDLATRACGWGDAAGYRTLNPFGGPSRTDGAAI